MSGIVRLTQSHLGDCLELSIEAGWNQTARDWGFIFEKGEVFGVLSAERVIACAAILPYRPCFAWICMMLVTTPERRKGHARALIGFCLARLEELSLVAGLDATPDGREVYGTLGFKDIYSVTRWARPAAQGPVARVCEATIEPLGEPLFPAVTAYDQQRFGATRGELLASLYHRAPPLAQVASKSGTVEGFVLGREGRLATQIGPLVADNFDLARELLGTALSQVQGACIIDAADHHREFSRALEGLGFERKRSFSRMLFATDRPIDAPEVIVAIAGPEFA
jgi:GNAT superfamily N-acetyltransferase